MAITIKSCVCAIQDPFQEYFASSKLQIMWKLSKKGASANKCLHIISFCELDGMTATCALAACTHACNTYSFSVPLHWSACCFAIALLSCLLHTLGCCELAGTPVSYMLYRSICDVWLLKHLSLDEICRPLSLFWHFGKWFSLTVSASPSVLLTGPVTP